MKTTIQELDGKYVVTLEGELDTAAAVEVEKKLQMLVSMAYKAALKQLTQPAQRFPLPLLMAWEAAVVEAMTTV